MPAKPLNDQQKQDAERLERAWLDFKAANPAMTQEKVAAECGWKTQGAFSQYIKGRIPLNKEALVKICNVIRTDPWSVSPTLMQELQTLSTASHGKIADNVQTYRLDKWPFETVKEADWWQIPFDQRKLIELQILSLSKMLAESNRGEQKAG